VAKLRQGRINGGHMKTIKKDNEIKRVEDEKADELVKGGSWSYCTKKEWKKNVRDKGKAPVKSVAKETPKDTKGYSKYRGKKVQEVDLKTP
jgi:hypothetical protein